MATWIRAEPGEHRVARALADVGCDKKRHEDERHRGEQRPALPRVADHLAEGVAERRADQQDRQHLEKVRERRRVFERVRRIDVVEAAAVGAELLDRDLRRRGPERNRLFGRRRLLGDRIALLVLERLAVGPVLRVVVSHRLDQRHRRVLVERLRHALAHQHERQDDRQRQQDVDRRADEIGPEVADAARFLAGEAADQRDEHRHSGGRRDEVLHGEPEHLREVAHRRFAAVTLPVGVRGEARRGVERGIRTDGGHRLRIERQPLLQPLQSIHDKGAGEVEPEHRQRVLDPAHLACGIDTGAAVDQPLERSADPLRPYRAAFVNRGHVRAERLRKRQQDDHVESQLEPTRGVHSKISGLNSATIR